MLTASLSGWLRRLKQLTQKIPILCSACATQDPFFLQISSGAPATEVTGRPVEEKTSRQSKVHVSQNVRALNSSQTTPQVARNKMPLLQGQVSCRRLAQVIDPKEVNSHDFGTNNVRLSLTHSDSLEDGLQPPLTSQRKA